MGMWSERAYLLKRCLELEWRLHLLKQEQGTLRKTVRAQQKQIAALRRALRHRQEVPHAR